MPIQLAKLSAVRKCSVDGYCVTIYSIFFSRFFTFYLIFYFSRLFFFLLASLLRLFFRTWNFDCSNCCMRILLKMLTAVTIVSLLWWSMDGVFSVHVKRCAFSIVDTRHGLAFREYSTDTRRLETSVKKNSILFFREYAKKVE
jgi:hypothetical protein